MTDTTNHRPLLVLTDGGAGPYIPVPVAQLAAVRQVLESHDIPHTVDETTISLDDGPEEAIIDLGRDGDAGRAQRALDSIT